MSYSDTTLDRRLHPMSPRQDTLTTKQLRICPTRFHLNRNILSQSDVDNRGGPSGRNLMFASRPVNPQKLSKRFSSAASHLPASNHSNHRPSAMGGVLATSSPEPPIIFKPPDSNWQKSKAKMFGLSVSKSHWFTASARGHSFTPDSPPKACETVAGDGNCLFRAFSFWITGSEDFHMEVREVIVQEINNNARLYVAVTSNHSITNYLRESQMSEEGVWGSEVEIFVAATLLQTPIAVFAAFGDRHLWQVFRPLRETEPRERYMLYLQNFNNHFEPVVDV